MRRIFFDKAGMLQFSINKEIQEVEMTLGALRSAGINSIKNVLVYTENAAGLYNVVISMINACIKKYNAEYGANIRPIRRSELAGVIRSTEDIQKLRVMIRIKYIRSMPKEKQEINEWTEDSGTRKIKPTVNRLIVMGTTVLGLSYGEVCSMTAGEVSQLLEDHNYINKAEPDNSHTSIKPAGVGDAGALL